MFVRNEEMILMLKLFLLYGNKNEIVTIISDDGEYEPRVNNKC